MKMSESMMENMMDESILGGMGGGMNMGGMQGMGGGRMGGGMGGGGRGGRGGGGRGGGRNNMGGGGGQGGAGGGGAHDRTMGGGRSQDDRLMERIMAISGPTHELPAIDTEEKKFSGRNRLYVGNLTNDVTEEEIQQMFAPYSEVSELFVNKEKNFAFLRLVSFTVIIFFYIFYVNLCSNDYKNYRLIIMIILYGCFFKYMI